MTPRTRPSRPRRRRPIVRIAVVALGLLVCLPRPGLAQTQTAATRYQQALAREQTARAETPPSPTTLRAIAKSYEAIVLRYPTSGYVDNALWQAAGLMSLAYGQSHDAGDRKQAERYLEWLRREYPNSALVKKVDGALAALEPPPAPPAPAPKPPTAAPKPAAATAPPPAAPKPPAATGAMLRSVTETPLPRGERVTLEFSQEVAFSGDRADNPDRVFFDFVNVTAPPATMQSAQALHGTLVKGLRFAKPSAGVTRVVVDLSGHPRYSAYALYDPFRLVIDIETDQPFPPRPERDASKASAPPPSPPPSAPPPSAPAAPASTTTGGDYSLARQLGLGVSRIVIDAGHGGHDPGAIANGVNEAELVLDVAHRLQKLLTDLPGFQVVLTRDGDEFIPLEGRTAIAIRENADLFLSIHANASPQSATRGVETYFLNFATNPSAEAVAARENASSSQAMGTLPEILKAIALNSKLKESRELATMVQTSLVRRLSVQNKALKDLGVKQAPFVVLIGAQMPSVLAEISFLTNQAEGALLRQSTYRQRIAQALCDAIVKYQASLKNVATVAAKNGKR
jgi:N-acetylmuramoyl-L-alanine amidase